MHPNYMLQNVSSLIFYFESPATRPERDMRTFETDFDIFFITVKCQASSFNGPDE